MALQFGNNGIKIPFPAFIWEVVFLCIFSWMCNAIQTGEIFYNWIWSSLLCVFSLSGWIQQLLIILAAICTFVIGSKHFEPIHLACEITRFQHYNAILRKRVMIFAAYCFANAILLSIAFTYLNANSNVFIPCRDVYDKPTSCLNERKFLIMFSSVLVSNGVIFWNEFHRAQYQIFSLIHTTGVADMVKIAACELKSACLSSIPVTLHFIPIWALLGRSLYEFVASLTFSNASVDGISYFGMLFDLWLYNSAILFSYKLMEALCEAYLLTYEKYPIKDDTNAVTTLKNALTAKEPLLEFLAYYDLYLVSQLDKVRRSMLFSLSYPGGHPYEWKSVLDAVAKLFDDCLGRLKIINGGSENNAINNTHVNLDTLKRKPAEILGIRQLSTKNVPHHKGEFLSYPNLIGLIAIPANFVAQKILLSRFVKYWFYDFAIETQIDALLQRAQSVEYAYRALSNLAVASMVEDKYGVVQHDLPNIVAKMFKLKREVDKMCMLQIKSGKSNFMDALVMKSLRYSIKSSLYKICVSFEPFLNDFDLSPDDQKLVRSFATFRE